MRSNVGENAEIEKSAELFNVNFHTNTANQRQSQVSFKLFGL
jgi:hypothetical protein